MENSKANTMNDTDRITRRAYEIWVAQGRPQGRAMEHWVQAEQEVRTGRSPNATPPAAQQAAKQQAELPQAATLTKQQTSNSKAGTPTRR